MVRYLLPVHRRHLVYKMKLKSLIILLPFLYCALIVDSRSMLDENYPSAWTANRKTLCLHAGTINSSACQEMCGHPSQINELSITKYLEELRASPRIQQSVRTICREIVKVCQQTSRENKPKAVPFCRWIGVACQKFGEIK